MLQLAFGVRCQKEDSALTLSSPDILRDPATSPMSNIASLGQFFSLYVSLPFCKSSNGEQIASQNRARSNSHCLW